jgi:hypothetical protein
MTDPLPFRAVDGGERKALADEARGLLENKAFSAAILGLRKQWFAEMMVAPPERLLQYQGMLRALESIPLQLQTLINDQKMAEARNK